MSILEPTSNSASVPAALRQRTKAARRRHAGRRWFAFAAVADALVLTFAVAVERLGGRSIGLSPLPEVWTVGFPAIAISLLAVGGLYRERLRLQLLDDLRTIAGATAVAAMSTIAIPVLAGADTSGLAAQGVRLWLFATVYLTASRSGIISSIIASRRYGTGPAPTLIVGAGSVGRLLAKRLVEHREIGLAPIGFLDKEPRDVDRTDDGAPVLPVLGASWDLGDVIDTHGVEHVVFTFSTAPHEVMLRMVDECTSRGVHVTLVPRLFERLPRDVTVDHLGGIPLLSIHPSSPGSRLFQVKYALDKLVAALAILALVPLYVVVATGVLISTGRPVLFRQRRVGCDGRVFEMLKFRSMRGAQSDPDIREVSLAVAPGGVEGEDRRTAFGTFIRRASLDELPQLFNVLRGEMSLVGPRPERPEFAAEFERNIYRYRERHRVKSGITGWSQISGLRGKTSISDRAEWDNFYIENFSLWLDLKIILMTFAVIARSFRHVE